MAILLPYLDFSVFNITLWTQHDTVVTLWFQDCTIHIWYVQAYQVIYIFIWQWDY